MIALPDWGWWAISGAVLLALVLALALCRGAKAYDQCFDSDWRDEE